jgi:DEAD/DEAH box helicase domain-containing protein
MRHIILDVETKKSFDEVGGYHPEKLEVSFCGVIERDTFPTKWGEKVKEQRYELFEKELPHLFKVMEQVDFVVGFNLDGFDMVALAPYYSGNIAKFPTVDLMLRFKEQAGHRISLDAIAQETLGTKKTGDGLDAIKYFRNGDLDKLAMYCMKDVEITRDIFDFGRLNGKVKYKNKWNEITEGVVDFTYAPNQGSGLQMSLL